MVSVDYFIQTTIIHIQIRYYMRMTCSRLRPNYESTEENVIPCNNSLIAYYDFIILS